MSWRPIAPAATLLAAVFAVPAVFAQSERTDAGDAAADRAALIELVERLKQDNADLNAALSQQDRLAAELKKAQDAADVLQQRLDNRGRALSDGQQRALEMIRLLDERDRRIAGLEQQLDDRGRELGDAQQRGLEMIQMLADKDRNIAALDQQLAEQDRRIAALDEQLTARDAMLDRQQRMLTSLRARVGQLQQAQETALEVAQQAQHSAQRYRKMLENARNNARALNAEYEARLNAQQERFAAALQERQGQVSALGVKLREARTERDTLAGELRSTRAKLEDTSNQQYVVKRGDSLSKIAKSFYGDSGQWRSIYQANRNLLSNPDGLAEGMTLKIPQR